MIEEKIKLAQEALKNNNEQIANIQAGIEGSNKELNALFANSLKLHGYIQALTELASEGTTGEENAEN
jgi:hypothetical protein